MTSWAEAIAANFYPRSPCGERRPGLFFQYFRKNFYPRSPCGERLLAVQLGCRSSLFLSTLSLRRATIRHRIHRQFPCHFYPRSPCGERPVMVGPLMYNLYFYPRSPCGERHQLLAGAIVSAIISIHALLAESDHGRHCGFCRDLQFLSTLSLRRATTLYDTASMLILSFLSTLSLRRATHAPNRRPCPRSISIHALLAESDDTRPPNLSSISDFYPRSPCGERLSALASKQNPTQHFYPRSPCGERRYR